MFASASPLRPCTSSRFLGDSSFPNCNRLRISCDSSFDCDKNFSLSMCLISMYLFDTAIPLQLYTICRFPGDSSFPVAMVYGFLAIPLLISVQSFLAKFYISFAMFATSSPLLLFLPRRFIFSHCNRLDISDDSSFNFDNISK